MEKIVLKWEGPFTFKDFLCDRSDQEKYRGSGVYLWLEEPNSEVACKVAYVGKAKTKTRLYNRIRYHYIHLISAAHAIPKKYVTDQNEWEGAIRKNPSK